jgi:threonine dehydrogenase-like Zn-dependent dehydrogenase
VAVAGNDAQFHAWASERRMPARRVTGYGYVYRGAFDRVIDCVGSRTSLTWALGALRPRGQLVLVSAPASLRGVDPTPIWYHELSCQGIYEYGPVPWCGEWQHPYAVLIPRLADGSLHLGSLVTHHFALADYLSAFEAAVRRPASHAIKVTFRLSNGSP